MPACARLLSGTEPHTYAFLFAAQGADNFDIETTPQKLPQKHVVAVRITSENASDGFKPTAGRVDEVRAACWWLGGNNRHN